MADWRQAPRAANRDVPEWLAEAERLRPLPYAKIAERLGLTYGQVYWWLNQGKGLDRTPKVVERACKHCGKTFTTRTSELSRGGGKWCSRQCYYAGHPPSKLSAEGRLKMTVGRQGRKNPNFRGGHRVGDREMRKTFCLDLKGEVCCRHCGSHDMLHLHHAIPRSMCRASRAEIRNGLPLCVSCHRRWHGRSLTLYRDIFTADEWAYLSSVQLTGQRIEAWLDDHYPDRGHPFRTAAGPRCGCGVLLLESGECPTCGMARYFDHEDRVA